jgi:O-antigen ligase
MITIPKTYPLLFIALLTMVFMSMDLGRNFEIPNANQIEKGLVILWAMTTVALGRINWFAVVGYVLVSITIFISAVFTEYEYFDYKTSIMSYTQIVAILFFFIAVLDERYMVLCLKIISFAASIALVVGIIFMAAGYRELFKAEYATGVARFGGSTIPAFMAGLSIMSALTSLYLWLRYDQRFKYVFVVSYLCLILTLGRMAILIGTILCYARFITFAGITKKTKVDVTIALFFLGIIGLAAIAPTMLERIENSGLSGRDILWHFVIYMINLYPDFGIGFGHQFLSTPEDIINMTASWSAHNEYLRVALEVGIIPSVFFFFFMFLTFMSPMLYYKRFDLFYFGAILLFFASCGTDNTISSPYMFLFLVSAYYIYALERYHDRRAIE